MEEVTKNKLRHLLRATGAISLDAFLRADSFEEIPLFQRISHIRFLKDFSVQERSFLLLNYSCDHVRLLAKEALQSNVGDGFFIMLSIDGWDEYASGEQCTPHFWATTDRLKILPYLRLGEAESQYGALVKQIIAGSELNAQFQLLESFAIENTDPDLHRVYMVSPEMRERCILSKGE